MTKTGCCAAIADPVMLGTRRRSRRRMARQAWVCVGVAAGLAFGFVASDAVAQSTNRPSRSACSSGSSYESGGAIYYTPGTDCATGGQIGASTGIASIRATRQITETLNDQNLSNIEKLTEGPTPVDTALPTFVAQYAPMDFLALKKGTPIIVDRTPVAPKYRAFGTVFGGGFDSVGIAGAGEKGEYYGGLVGVDFQASNSSILGVSIGGSGSRVSIDSLAASGRVAGVNGSIYFITAFDKFYAQTVTTLSSFDNDTSRFVAGPGALNKASFGSFEARERLEFGRIVDLSDTVGIPKFKVVPFIAVEFANLHQNGHTEVDANGTGSGSELTTNGTDIFDMPGFVGARVEASYGLGNGMTLRPIVRLAYVHQFSNAPVIQNALIATPNATLAANTRLLGPDSVLTKAGFELDVSKSTVAFANFDGLFSGNDSLYGGRAGVRYSF